MLSASKSGQYGGYQISRSVRVRGSASGYFTRTLSVASTSSTIFTWSGWVKRGSLAASRMTIAYHGNTGATGGLINLEFNSDATLRCFFDGTNTIQTTAVYRDPSAWYHIMLAYDSTQATASNRAKLYVNGMQITAFSTANYPPLNQAINAGVGNVQNLGLVSTSQFDGYLTELNFIDGQALTPSSFGVTNSYGVWSPIKYNGTYGNNGFYLNFSDNSGATATTIGKDSSGNSNNFTPNNISVTAGVTYDSMLDVPTPWGDGGNGRGNYCTLNRLVASGLSGGGVLSNGNLRVAGSAGVSNAYARGTMALSGKFYAEFFFDVVNATASIGVDVVTATAGALNTSSTNVSYRSGGNKRVLGTETAYGASWVANDIIGVAVDTTANTIEFFKNGASQGVITSSAFFAQGDCIYAMSKDDVGSPTGQANFGQRPFSYTPPTGFNALNTFNLLEPSIQKGNQYFDVSLYTGNGTTQTVTNSGGFTPDLVWNKGRSVAYSHGLVDSVRGNSNILSSNTTAAEANPGAQLDITTNGFISTYRAANLANNQNAATYVCWQWRAGVSAVTNTAGTITSTVDAGTTQGFSIVTYTGTGANATVGHGLGIAPKMIIVKARSAVNDWPVYHANQNATPQNGLIYLNATNAYAAAATVWNSTAPTSTLFSVGTNGAVNASSQTFVAYCFAEITGFSRFGGYTGNGSADGPFVFCGFRPRWVMFKKTNTSTAGDWTIYDTARDPYNVMPNILYPNLANAETGGNALDTLSNGFKIRSTGQNINTNGDTYIFAAFAENPFKYSLAR
jgi:hypothetical protein